MEEQLPYRAEYAKSNRSMCKGCKLNISQGTLRLAVMVQSPFHDGKQPNWFHSGCFFNKQRPRTVGDIAYYINLKYDDQKMIKEKIDSSTAIVAPEINRKGKDKNKKRTNTSTALKDFGIEYSKSSRAECRGCQQKILKGELRIKKVVFDTEVGMKYGGQPLWHHVDCFEKIRDDLLYFESGDQLPGFKELKKEDQIIIKNTVKAKADAPAIKKVKLEAEDEVDIAKKVEEEKTIIKQNNEMYTYKTKLGDLTKQELIDILEDNDQYIPAGMSLLIDAVADILTFGAIQPCKECKDGSFVISANTYVCNGNLDEWVKCLKTVQAPPRKKTVISSELRNKYSFFGKYKSKVTHRVFPHFTPSASFGYVKKEEGGSSSSPRVQREKPKLSNMEFVIIGETNIDKEELKALIAKLGGNLKTKIHAGVTAIISNPNEVEKMNKRMTEAENLGIHVITDAFFAAVQDNPDPIKLLDKHCICGWAIDPLTRIPKEEERKPKKSIYSKSSKSSKITLKLKGGGAVDPDSELEDVAHVFEQGGLKYNAILTLTDLQAGKNAYYKLQLLEADKGNKYWLFRAWGRIGTTIGGTKIANFATLIEAKKEFEALYVEKSGSEFGEPYFKLPGFYQPVDIDYSDTSNKFEVKCDIPSKLESPVQNLIKLLFDVDLMKKVMLEFELDTEKMPLGKLSRKQIEKAVVTLNDISKMIAKGSSQHEFIGASNRFYTLIPHDFGIEQPPLLDTNEMIKTKMEMLESLMEIELAYNMLTDKKLDENINPIDAHYEQLNTSMDVLDPATEEFKILQQYVKNTHAETHKMYDLEIENIFKISRIGEEKRFKPFKKLHNRKLLWHGSRLTNFVGILSHGLKIAPPEAPVTGYMFGKGIYFADMVSKSANYCFTSKSNNTGLLMLCEVALGDMVEYTAANYVTQLPKNKHSVKGIGSTAPNPVASIKREDGVEIPCGNPVTDPKAKTSLLYNEFIVYDVAQVKAQYLFKLKFNYKY